MKYIFAAILLLLVGCAAPRYMEWPAEVADISGFTDSQYEEIVLYLDEINKETGRTLLTFEPRNSQIYIQFVNEIPQTDPEKESIVIGQAHIEVDRCTILLVKFVAEDPEWLKPVLWHEFGHCAGLRHVKAEHEVMSAFATPLEMIEPAAINRFIESLCTSTIEK